MKVVLRRADGAWSLSSQTFATKSAITAPEQMQQLTCVNSPYSITLSARAMTVGGTVMPSRLADLKIDVELECGRLLHRQVRRLGALENLVHVGRRSPHQVGHTGPVAQEAANLHQVCWHAD